MATKRHKRPTEPIQRGKLIGDILTGQIEDKQPTPETTTAAEYARKGGLKGGKARAERLTPEQRRAIAKKASSARWGTGTAAAQTKKVRQER